MFRKQRYYGKFLPYHPEWKGGVRLGLPIRKEIRATWKTDWESECFKGPSNLPDEKLDAKTIHSLDIRFSLPGRVGITAEAENLTDVHTQDRRGYPKPGRGYYLTLSWDWERAGLTRRDGSRRRERCLNHDSLDFMITLIIPRINHGNPVIRQIKVQTSFYGMWAGSAAEGIRNPAPKYGTSSLSRVCT